MPQIGFGTWGLAPQDVDRSIRAAVQAGYRLFDLAPVYHNERAIGKTFSALFAEGVVSRDSLFFTSKVPPDCACDKTRLMAQLRQTLRDLQTPYLDLYHVHWPFCVRTGSPTWPPPYEYELGYSAQQLHATWSVMESIVDAGLVRSIGLSNIGLHRLEALLAHPALRYAPAVLQNEHHPYNANRELRAFCAARSPPIRFTAYSSLGSGARPSKHQLGQPALLDDAVMTRVAAEAHTTPAALALAWAVRSGVAIIPKSAHEDRIAANLGSTLELAPKLSPEHMRALDALDRRLLYLAEGWRGYAWRAGMTLEELRDDPSPASSYGWLWGAAVLVAGGVACRCRAQRRLP